MRPLLGYYPDINPIRKPIRISTYFWTPTVNNEGIEEDWIIEAKNKLPRKFIEGEICEGSELRGEKAGIADVRRKILARKDVPIADEENNAETYLFLLRENKKANDLLREATTMHETLVESLWQYKLRKKSSIMETDSDSDSEIDLMD